MGKTKKKDQANKTVYAKTIILPAVVLIVIIMASMIVSVHTANNLNGKLAGALRDSTEYVEQISDFMAGVSLLNETSASFIVNPIDGEGNVIYGQLMPFATELSTGKRRADDVLEVFKDYDVSDETMQYLNDACVDARFFLETQLHAIALVTSVYPLPQIPTLNPVLNLEISAEEANMPEPARLGLAKSMVLNEEYATHRKSLAASINDAIRTVKEHSSIEIEDTNRKVSAIKTIVWVLVSFAVIILAIVFIIIALFLVHPLSKASRLFLHNKRLNENYGLQEFRIAATSYNNLLDRRDMFESLLKKTAETDVLTGLPNRYAYENYIKKLDEAKGIGIYPLCYYSFDLNYLKFTNDTYGHLVGDRLLEKAARIIKECFGDNCYRIGGDEFAAFIKRFDEKEGEEAEKQFLSMLAHENVSVSFGNSITDDFNEKSIDEMMVEADKMMYERKRLLHKLDDEKKDAKLRS